MRILAVVQTTNNGIENMNLLIIGAVIILLLVVASIIFSKNKDR